MSWARIQGHEHLIDGFRRVVQRGRLAHAYLFCGPAGVGKRLFAQELAKALLCEDPAKPRQDLAACDRCPACIQVSANTHPDFFTVQRPEDKNEFPIDVVQELCAGFSLKPARGLGKIAIVDDADTLNDESANCFLKTLEEPPPGSVLILVGTSAERQLPTIRSRCQAVRFGPLTDEQVASVLRQQDIEDTALLSRLVRLAAGSPGQGLALAEPALWDLRKRLLKGLAAAQIDTVALGKSFAEFVEDAGKEGSLQRRRASLALELLIDAFRDALRLGLGGELKSADPEDLRLIRALMDRASPEKIVAVLERCLQTEQQIDRYVQLALVLDALLDALSQTLEEGAPALR